ncbi:MAG: EFR1 family ferrodoxin [Desulfobacterium sp.]|nr:EFR1 family ferrodoxin [Desulfobacterium sp.]
MKLAIIFFSPTGNTAKMAREIKINFETMGVGVDGYDITARSDREKGIDLGPYQGIVFGFPVHSLRAPKVVREWLRTLEGHGKKASLFFTYGGFTVHPAHHSTRQILTEQNFTVVSSAEFPGAHPFNLGGWRAFTDRPNESDFNRAQTYSQATLNRFTGQDPGMLGDLEQSIYSGEQLDGFEALRFKIITQLPTRAGRECRLCMACEDTCPTGAMDAATGRVDSRKCIACLGCVANCPDQALSINDTTPSWAFKLDLGKTTEQDLNRQQGKIYL